MKKDAKPRTNGQPQMPANAQPLSTLLPPEVQEELAKRRKIFERIEARALVDKTGQWSIAYLLMVVQEQLGNLDYRLDQLNLFGPGQHRRKRDKETGR